MHICIYIYIYIYTHTHTHIDTYIYIYICVISMTILKAAPSGQGGVRNQEQILVSKNVCDKHNTITSLISIYIYI